MRSSHCIIVYRDTVPLFTRVIHATTFLGRLRGLQGRVVLGADEGLLLTPCHRIHTMAMRLAIDVLFLDHRGVLVGLAPAVPPWRAAGAAGARHSLEVQAGSIQRLALTKGQRLHWHPDDCSPRPVASCPTDRQIVSASSAIDCQHGEPSAGR